MKILAIEQEIEGINWDNKNQILKEEATHVYEQYLKGYLREIYFTENKTAVLILETDTKISAKKLLGSFPLVREKLIRFDILELHPYNGLDRLLKPE